MISGAAITRFSCFVSDRSTGGGIQLAVSFSIPFLPGPSFGKSAVGAHSSVSTLLWWSRDVSGGGLFPGLEPMFCGVREGEDLTILGGGPCFQAETAGGGAGTISFGDLFGGGVFCSSTFPLDGPTFFNAVSFDAFSKAAFSSLRCCCCFCCCACFSFFSCSFFFMLSICSSLKSALTMVPSCIFLNKTPLVLGRRLRLRFTF
mmetsp:Transcript_759/g.1108  ORF Transcript_759/g.1108 Transcript_759/m.1108 type:complete len:203 (-) Transcript_759:1180-1788(-)